MFYYAYYINKLRYIEGDIMEKKTSKAQIEAVKRYNEKNGLVTIACKVTKEYRKAIQDHAASKGFTSVNAYLLDLIERDITD